MIQVNCYNLFNIYFNIQLVVYNESFLQKNNIMVFKNCKVYLVFVFFFYKVVEKLNLNIVYVVDREKDGVRIFF